MPRIASLRGARADVWVISPTVLPAIGDLADRGLLTLLPRELKARYVALGGGTLDFAPVLVE